MNQLDFTSPKLQQWLKSCPFKVRNIEQMVYSTKPVQKKEVSLIVEIPIAECALNFQYFGLSLKKKTEILEERYELLDQQYKKLIIAEVKEKNPVKLIQLEERSSAIYKERRAIISELKAMIEAEKTGV